MEDMQHQQMGYDRAATMFSPTGQILQVEYAEKTVRLGSSSIGMISKEGVVIISHRRHRDKLMINASANKISEIDEHIICVSAGIMSDARVLVERARVTSQQHRINYDSAPNTESIVRDIADVKQQFTQHGGARPFGVSMMIGGFNGKPILYTTDITGNYFQYKANAIGENDEKLKKFLEQKYKEEMTNKEVLKLGLAIFKEVQGSDFDIERFDVGILSKDKILKLSGNEIEKF
jgi:proteasome alpha subunit